MHQAAAQGAFLLQQYERLLNGLEDRHRGLEPAPGLKTAGWLVGHLVITGDFARRLCGRVPPLAPKEWRALFSPGTQPAEDVSAYPSMADLLGTFRAVYWDVVAHAGTASEETLSQPNPFEAARAGFPTAGEFVAYLLTGHFGYHLGQLSQWRVAAAGGDSSLRA